MRKAICLLAIMAALNMGAQEYKVVTVIESIVPMGAGRSRIVETQGEADIDALTTVREGRKSKQDKVDRGDIKDIGEGMKETKLLNFYSLTGINFGNVASNDAVIAAKINEMAQAGYKLTFVTSGVESDAGEKDGNGIFITRMFFVKD